MGKEAANGTLRTERRGAMASRKHRIPTWPESKYEVKERVFHSADEAETFKKELGKRGGGVKESYVVLNDDNDDVAAVHVLYVDPDPGEIFFTAPVTLSLADATVTFDGRVLTAKGSIVRNGRSCDLATIVNPITAERVCQALFDDDEIH
jgi:hypothetical protein